MDMCNLNCKTCDKCGKEFCSKNPKNQLTQHLKWCEKKHFFLEKYSLNSEIIQREYENCGSVLNFKEKYPFWDNFVHYYRLFKEMNIDYSLKNSLNSEQAKNKRKKTSLERYGFESNFLKDTPSRQKWEKRLFDEEGITNVFQRKEVKEKSIKTLIEKYGTELFKHKMTVRGRNVVSNLNIKIFDILKELNIPFKIEFKVLKDNGYYYSYDILLENNKIIEVYGDYWHGNPKIYKKDDLILKNTKGEIKVKNKWEKDKIKINFIKERGYSVLILWEKEIKEDFEKIKEKIYNYAKS